MKQIGQQCQLMPALFAGNLITECGCGLMSKALDELHDGFAALLALPHRATRNTGNNTKLVDH